MCDHYFDVEDYYQFHHNLPEFGKSYNAPIYCLFQIDRNHELEETTIAKVSYIDRMYSAQIGNYVARVGVDCAGQPAATWLARSLSQNPDFAEIMRVSSERPALSAASIADYQNDLADFVYLVRAVCNAHQGNGQGPRSFCSKYLHFHNRSLPIFDRDALNVVSLLWQNENWRQTLEEREGPLRNNLTYDIYSARILTLLNHIHGEGDHCGSRVKDLDHYLIARYRKLWPEQ